MSVVNLAVWAPTRRVVIPPTWLVCLNLRSRFAQADHPHYVPDLERVLPRMAHALDFARANGWRIVHVIDRPTTAFNGAGRTLNSAMAGLEPRIDEPVYQKSGPSAFTAYEMLEHAHGIGPAEILVAGFAPALDWIATALDARDLGWPIRIASDAMGMPALCDRSAEDSRDTLSVLLSPIADIVPLEQALQAGHAG